jgi:DNA-binding transcriptional ArsR family regulator
VHAFDVLGDPVRRRIVELLGEDDLTAGEITAQVQQTFAISQPGVSQHLRVLRDSGFAVVRPDGTRRVYSLSTGPLAEIDAWLQPYRRHWAQRLDALDTEIRRGRRRVQNSDDGATE